MVSVSFVFLISTALQIAVASNDNLVAVVQIFRHGQRTPTGFYPNDPYGDLNTYWGGLPYGALTNEGKRQHYALGEFTRSRYSDWLPTAYNKDIIYAQTTDVDRTHMSAQSNLYGLFPASGTQVWKSSVNWQPIPVHPSDTTVVSTSMYPCSTSEELINSLLNTSEYTDIDLTYASVYSYASNYSGSNITTFSELGYLYDSLIIEDQLGYSLPSWTSQIYPEPSRTLWAKYWELLTHTTQLKRLMVGVWFNEVIEYFESMLEDPTSSPKYQMYSAHDLNVASVLNTIGNFNSGKPVPFTASIWFELRTVNWVNVINVWYKESDNFTQLSINGCDLDCPLSTVKTLLTDVILDADTWTEECV